MELCGGNIHVFTPNVEIKTAIDEGIALGLFTVTANVAGACGNCGSSNMIQMGNPAILANLNNRRGLLLAMTPLVDRYPIIAKGRITEPDPRSYEETIAYLENLALSAQVNTKNIFRLFCGFTHLSTSKGLPPPTLLELPRAMSYAEIMSHVASEETIPGNAQSLLAYAQQLHRDGFLSRHTIVAPGTLFEDIGEGDDNMLALTLKDSEHCLAMMPADGRIDHKRSRILVHVP